MTLRTLYSCMILWDLINWLSRHECTAGCSMQGTLSPIMPCCALLERRSRPTHAILHHKRVRWYTILRLRSLAAICVAFYGRSHCHLPFFQNLYLKFFTLNAENFAFQSHVTATTCSKVTVKETAKFTAFRYLKTRVRLL